MLAGTHTQRITKQMLQTCCLALDFKAASKVPWVYRKLWLMLMGHQQARLYAFIMEAYMRKIIHNRSPFHWMLFILSVNKLTARFRSVQPVMVIYWKPNPFSLLNTLLICQVSFTLCTIKMLVWVTAWRYQVREDYISGISSASTYLFYVQL